MIGIFGISGLLGLLIFYLAHTGDLVSTLWGLRANPLVHEKNPIFSWTKGNPWKMGFIKYSLASVIPITIILEPGLSVFLLIDTLLECGVTLNNVYQVLRKR